jgi:uncharacterized RDD family membrane protein YckC
MSENLYRAPQARVADAPAEASPGLPDASKGRRFANLLLDTVFFYVCALLLGVALGLAGLADQLEGMGAGAEFLLGWTLITVYYVVQEGLWGWTFAKLITGTRVVNAENGTRPSLWRILGRTLARLVPFEPFSFFGKEPRGWHDRWSGTRVVFVRSG